MEVLSPPTFRKPEDLAGGDRSRIASLENGVLPWENGGEKSRQNQRLYYQVILGSIEMEAAVTALLELYRYTNGTPPNARRSRVRHHHGG